MSRRGRRGRPSWRYTFLRDIGQRIHIIRRARHRTTDDVARLIGLRPLDLHDPEHGEATANALLLYRLAAALQVPDARRPQSHPAEGPPAPGRRPALTSRDRPGRRIERRPRRDLPRQSRQGSGRQL